MRVTIQQAAMNALAAWLRSRFSDVEIYDRWPEPQVDLTKAITIIRSGPRQNDYIDPVVIRQTNLSDTQAIYTWRLCYCTQPIQLDVWATSDIERDDIMARLDDVMHAGDRAASVYNPDPVDNGVLVNFNPADGWSGHAAFRFDGPDLIETADQVQQVEYRAVYAGDAYFELTVDSTSPRMTQIALMKKLYEADSDAAAISYETTTVNSGS